MLEVLRVDWETLRELLTPTNTLEVARAFHSFLELFSVWSFMGVVACDILLRFIGEKKGWTWTVRWQERRFTVDSGKYTFTLFRLPAHNELVSAKSLLKTNSLIWFAFAIMLEFATHRYSERIDALTDEELSVSQKQIGAALITSSRAIERATTLESIIQPRYLTDEETQQIKEGLKTIPGSDLMIGSHWIDAESARLARQIKAALNSAGIGRKPGNPEDLIGKWPRVPLGPFGGGELHGPEIHVGVEVWGKDKQIVADTLRSVTHLDVTTPDGRSPFDFDAPNLVSVFVGLKPAPLSVETARISARTQNTRLDTEARQRVTSALSLFPNTKFNLFGYRADSTVIGLANDILFACCNVPKGAGWTATLSDVPVGDLEGVLVFIKPSASGRDQEAAKALVAALHKEHLAVVGPRTVMDHRTALGIVGDQPFEGTLDPNNPITIVIGNIR